MKRRVVILGGGLGAVSAALALTSTPERRASVEVTLYQQGFRLGGKGASGRNAAAGQRIEEHGLHLWLGFYAHAFRLLRDVYQALGRDVRDAFEPQPRVLLPEDSGPGWELRVPLLPGDPWDPQPDAGPLALLGHLRRGLATLGPQLGVDGPRARRLSVLADLGRAAVRGLVREVLPNGFASIDDRDLKRWLVQHGARPESVEAQPLRALYALAFAFPSGAGPGDAAAGVTLRALLQLLFLNRGALAWRMRGGMGDVVFAPIYELLRARGVTFRFFHEVRELLPDAAGVGEIVLNRQLRSRGEYEPLVEVFGRRCWPSEPRWGALEGHAAPEALERQGAVEGAPVRLLRGADFDELVLGISVGGLRPLTSALAARSPAFARMLDHAQTVATHAVQLWLGGPAAASGFPTGAVVGGAPRPFDSAADMSFLLPIEQSTAAGLVYACGAASDEPVEGGPARLLESWPLRPAGIVDRYVRLNRDGSDRYVLSTAGSIRHRLHPRGSGFDNLSLAGDWTWTPLSCGCVEAAVTSGLLAAGETV